MAEAPSIDLEQKRFIITPESMTILKKARSVYRDLSQDYPYLAGIGFYGSRTRGSERPDSDLDIKIFYDANKAKPDSDYLSGLDQIKDKVSTEIGIETDDHMWAKDISLGKTDIDIYNYFRSARALGGYKREEVVRILGSLPEAENLFSRFFLSVGDGLYENRQYVLDQFSELADGDKLFGYLMSALASFERDRRNTRPDIPRYGGMPTTIAEARDYFRMPQEIK